MAEIAQAPPSGISVRPSPWNELLRKDDWWAIWIGLYPQPYFDVLKKPVAQIVERVKPGYYEKATQAALPREALR